MNVDFEKDIVGPKQKERRSHLKDTGPMAVPEDGINPALAPDPGPRPNGPPPTRDSKPPPDDHPHAVGVDPDPASAPLSKQRPRPDGPPSPDSPPNTNPEVDKSPDSFEDLKTLHSPRPDDSKPSPKGHAPITSADDLTAYFRQNYETGLSLFRELITETGNSVNKNKRITLKDLQDNDFRVFQLYLGSTGGPASSLMFTARRSKWDAFMFGINITYGMVSVTENYQMYSLLRF